jgi:LmbE family N-acetylglucosaminyl deacetylase
MGGRNRRTCGDDVIRDVRARLGRRRPHRRGNPESRWQEWPELRAWPALALGRPPATVVVVAPHPDDEVLGVGGLLSLLARAGSSIHVVAVTDGEASHPGSPTVTPEQLARRRVEESQQALAALGAPTARIERLRLPDGRVTDVEAESGIVTATVLRLLASRAHLGPAWCLVPWARDGHPDHNAAGQAAVTGALGSARILAYPVWMWHWAQPGDPRVPWSYARRVPLQPEVLAAKQAAVRCFRTQIAPLSEHPADAAVLPPGVLARLTRDTEVVFELW